MPKKRKTRRRRRKGGLGRLLRPLSFILTVVAVVAALTMFFKVSAVEVVGSSRYQSGEVAAASGVELGDNLVLLDKYHIAQRICTELPYVTETRINRKFPSTLVIEVTETKALASIQGDGGRWLLNVEGKLLEAVDESGAQDYLQIQGVEAVNPAVSRYLELPEDSPITMERLTVLLTALENRGMMARADGLDFSDRSDLVLGYDGRLQVIISYDADFDYKLGGLLGVMEKLEPNERGTLRMNMKDDTKAHFIPSSE